MQNIITAIIVLATPIPLTNGSYYQQRTKSFRLLRFELSSTCNPNWITTDSLKVHAPANSSEVPRLMGTVQVHRNLDQKLFVWSHLRMVANNMTCWGSWSNPCKMTQDSYQNYWSTEVEPSSIAVCPIKKGEYKILNFIMVNRFGYPDGEYQLRVALVRKEEMLCSGILHLYIK
nr:uncharacterized protein LOC115268742 [Aedes albopictus]